MSKRTTNKKIDRDFWPTKDPDAVAPLFAHLPEDFSFDEPCAGDGSLINLIYNNQRRIFRASDIYTHHDCQDRIDVFNLTDCKGDMFITNPPWTWSILTRIISHLSAIAPTWLLLNADLAHNKRMGPHMKKCVKIVSVGRVSWMNNGKKGFENAAWYLFDQNHTGTTEFYGRL